MFLPNSIVTGMPYLPAKDELVSLNRLSSRGLWKWYNSKVFDRRLYGVGQHFTFCRFSRKRKFFGNFDCDLRKSFIKGFFLTEYEEFRNFRFDGKFSRFYRRQLLKCLSWKSWNLTKVVVCFSQSVEWTGECTLWSLKNLQVLIYSKLHEKNHVITYTKVIVLYCILLVLVNNIKRVALRTCP